MNDADFQKVLERSAAAMAAADAAAEAATAALEAAKAAQAAAKAIIGDLVDPPQPNPVYAALGDGYPCSPIDTCPHCHSTDVIATPTFGGYGVKLRCRRCGYRRLEGGQSYGIPPSANWIQMPPPPVDPLCNVCGQRLQRDLVTSVHFCPTCELRRYIATSSGTGVPPIPS